MDEEPRRMSLGDLAVDATSIITFAVLLAKGALRGLMREQKGIAEVLREIVANQATFGARAGIMVEDVRALQLATERLATVRQYIGTVRKLLRILESTEASLDNERHQMISIIAASVDKRGKLAGNEDLLFYYQVTRAYRSAIANKAAQTRDRNAKAKAKTKTEANVKSMPEEEHEGQTQTA
jgi:hypothetical protein